MPGTAHPDREAMPYRECAGVVVFNRQGKVFIGRRKPGKKETLDNVWQMPQGGIDRNEEPIDAALRELYEETSIKSVSILTAMEDWVFYDLPDEALGVALKGKYRGQKQKWFAVLFEGDEGEIDVHAPGGGAHEAEFDDWRWEDLQALPGLIVPFKRKVYEEVAAAFSDIPSRLHDA